MNEAGPSQHRRSRNRSGSARAAITLAVVALATAIAGCQRDEVSHFRVPKATGTGLAAAAPMGAMGGPGPMTGADPGQGPMGGGMEGDVAPPPAPEGGGLRWSLPKGWSETKGGGPMRFATMRPTGAGKAEVSVIVLPGPAGGELANVNRWRNQIGLAPLADADLPALRKTVKAKVGPISVYDFTSDGQKKSRVVAGLTENAGSTWFVKLSGDAEAVSAARPAFMSLLESLRSDADAK
ncbi:hypothetical protein [Anaeromyxobacter oryzae]|uniref:Lipoprotein n=1 Tax=Anaeromyxobacter oryzae TaxID=2918170 RepID=A0ABM7WNS9_9BACT|nr:hypothetical protein [Anaeromyxobacter oryzae]BDG01123.1 hypothetical protein AMOR_01190 [Anaeromyxobacter oryzae]